MFLQITSLAINISISISVDVYVYQLTIDSRNFLPTLYIVFLKSSHSSWLKVILLKDFELKISEIFKIYDQESVSM